MAVAVDTPNLVADDSPFNGTSTSTSVTVGASDNLLLVMVGQNFNASPFNVPPDAFTYNGVSLTLLGFAGNSGNVSATSVWYLSNPPVGTFTLAGSWTTNTHGGPLCVTAIPISGAASTSIFGTLAKAQSTANNNPAVTATGGATGSLYIAAAENGVGTTVGTGSGQTDISATNGQGGGANVSFNVSTIAGSGSGAFTWSGSGASDGVFWTAVGVNVNAAPYHPYRRRHLRTSSTTAVTGTGGTALPALTVGQVLDILVQAQSATALTQALSDPSGAI